MSENTFTKIYEVVKKIPKGQVATYGQVARLAGNKRWSRLWGMHFTQTLTCYRGVDRNGNVSKAFVFGGENRQLAYLKIKFNSL